MFYSFQKYTAAVRREARFHFVVKVGISGVGYMQVLDRGAVSYTHLTLPTILRV